MKKYRFQVFIFWLLFTSGVISIYGVFYLASIGYFGEMPDFRQLENPKTNFASEIISSDNKVLGKYYFNDNRTPIEYEDINPETINALIAIEDERFYSHPGIDLKATLRAIVFLNQEGVPVQLHSNLQDNFLLGLGQGIFFKL